MITRDPWADAHQVVTQAVLEPDLVAMRRRLRISRAAGLVLGCAVLLGIFWLVRFVLDTDADELWRVRLRTLYASFGLMGLGFVLVIVGAVRTSGAVRPFVGSDAFLTQADRLWLRTQVAEGRPVPDDRRAVVADAARGMVVEGRYLPTYVGLTVVYVGILAGGPSLGSLITFSALIVWMLVRAARGAIWSRHARRWLAQHA